jgi:hypothetical protein
MDKIKTDRENLLTFIALAKKEEEDNRLVKYNLVKD